MIDLRRLPQLVVLAEELNFHRAARRLHLSQPALSRSIHNLELELGVVLVERSTRPIGLTEAGAELVAKVKPLIESLADATEQARATSGSHRIRLRLGFKAGVAGGLVGPVVTAFEEAHPEVEITVRRLSWQEQEQAILDQRVDLALLAPITKVDERLIVNEVVREDRVLCVALDHPLANEDSVTIGQMANDPFVTATNIPEDVGRWWAAVPRPDGSSPPKGPLVSSIEEMLEVVAMGRAISFVGRSVELIYGRPDVAFVPVIGLDKLPIAVAWRKGEHGQIFEDFLATARQVACEGAVPALSSV